MIIWASLALDGQDPTIGGKLVTGGGTGDPGSHNYKVVGVQDFPCGTSNRLARQKLAVLKLSALVNGTLI
jgi:hypothetical protein